jgi:hypothetical protein
MGPSTGICTKQGSVSLDIAERCGTDISCLRIRSKEICDNVSMRVQLYYGDSNEQDTGWTDYQVPADDFFWDSDTFQLNKTGTYTMKVRLTSTGVGTTWINPADNSRYPVIEYVALVNFTVSEDGSEYGECKTTSLVNPVVSYDVEGIKKAFEGFGNTWTSNILYMLVMLILGGALVLTLGSGRSLDKSDSWVWGVLFFVEGLLMLIGVWIGALSVIWLILLGLLIVIPIAAKLSAIFRGDGR